MTSDIDEEHLVVNKTKVSEVRNWLIRHNFKSFDSYSSTLDKILVITGPCGSGKTTTLKALCNSLSINICEWDDISHLCFRPSLQASEDIDLFEVTPKFSEFLFQGQRFYSSLHIYF